MENTLYDLHNHLFLELERLNDEDLTEEQLTFETTRAKNLSSVAKTILDTANVLMEAQKHFDMMGYSDNEIPKILKLQTPASKPHKIPSKSQN